MARMWFRWYCAVWLTEFGCDPILMRGAESDDRVLLRLPLAWTLFDYMRGFGLRYRAAVLIHLRKYTSHGGVYQSRRLVDHQLHAWSIDNRQVGWTNPGRVKRAFVELKGQGRHRPNVILYSKISDQLRGFFPEGLPFRGAIYFKLTKARLLAVVTPSRRRQQEPWTCCFSSFLSVLNIFKCDTRPDRVPKTHRWSRRPFG